MRSIFFVILLFFGVSCDKTTEPTYDPTATIIGTTVSAESNELIDSVLIGFKSPDVPDSLIFVGDSIITTIPNSIVLEEYTLNGYFEFGFAFVSEPPVEYKNMFAYKSGKKLWGFNSIQDTVHQLISNTDSLRIRLINK